MTALVFAMPVLLLLQADQVSLEFIVHAPRTSPDAKIYIAGNVATLGNWRPDGLKLRHNADGTWGGSINVPRGQAVEFKVTCGSWETVEKSASGADIANRTWLAD